MVIQNFCLDTGNLILFLNIDQILVQFLESIGYISSESSIARRNRAGLGKQKLNKLESEVLIVQIICPKVHFNVN